MLKNVELSAALPRQRPRRGVSIQHYSPNWHRKNPGNRASGVVKSGMRMSVRQNWKWKNGQFRETLPNYDCVKNSAKFASYGFGEFCSRALVVAPWPPKSAEGRLGRNGGQRRKLPGSRDMPASCGENGPVRPDSVERDNCKGRAALTALFHDGTVALKCSELTKCDAGGRFRMSIRYKNGTFYDENSVRNTPGIRCPKCTTLLTPLTYRIWSRWSSKAHRTKT